MAVLVVSDVIINYLYRIVMYAWKKGDARFHKQDRVYGFPCTVLTGSLGSVGRDGDDAERLTLELESSPTRGSQRCPPQVCTRSAHSRSLWQ